MCCRVRVPAQHAAGATANSVQSYSILEALALPIRWARTTDRGARMRTGEVRPKTSDKTELTNKLLVTTRNSHCTIHSNPALTRCKYNNYITIQRSFHPIFHTQVDKNAAYPPQDAKNIHDSRITRYQTNAYLFILLISLPISLHFPRRDSKNTYQNRKLQPKSCAKPRKIAAFCRIYSQASHFSSEFPTQSSLKTPFHCFYLADVRPFVPSPPPSAAAASALSAAFWHLLPVLPQKPRVFGDFPSIFAATSTRQRLYLVLSPKTNESCTPKQARLAAKRQQRRPPQPNEKFDCGGKTKAPSSPQPKKTERTSCAKRMRMNMARG